MAKNRFPRWLLLLTCFPVVGISLLLAQPKQDILSAGRASEGWSVRDLYPNANQVKIEMSGTEATPLNSGLVLISNLVIKNFALTGGPPKSVIEAPQCFYDPQMYLAFSPGPLKMRAEDGRLFVDGLGFHYETTNSVLVISNRVHTVIYQGTASAGSATSTNTPPTHVYSDSLTYATKSGQAIYRDHARIEDPKMRMRAGILTAQLPPEGSKISHLGDSVAEDNVLIDFIGEKGDTNHAAGDKAIYKYRVADFTTNEFMELSGHARIDLTNGWMTAELFTFDRLQDRIRGIGNYHFHSSANIQFGGATSTNGPPAETQIQSDFFEFETKTGLAGYEGRVRVRNPSLELDAEKLLARLPPGGMKTNFSQRVVAETNVVINFIDKDGRTRATGERAVYTYLQLPNNVITNEVLQLIGNPVLERTNGWMAADVVTLDRSNGKLRGRGHQHSVIHSAPVRPGASASSGIATNTLGTSDTEIFSENAVLTMETSDAYYDGQVHMFSPQLTVNSETLLAKFPARGGTNSHVERIVADGKVAIESIDDKGATNHASGDRAIYDYKVSGGVTNSILQLVGHPYLEQSGKKFRWEKAIIYNLITGEITGLGRPDFELTPNAPATTRTNAAPKPVGR